MNRKTFVSILCAICLCLAVAVDVTAQDSVQVGVSPGDVFKYDVAFFWSSTASNSTIPEYWVQANTTDYIQATITEVSGTTVSIQTIQRFLNGTEISGDEVTDVSHGEGGSLFVYAANLTAGDPLYPAVEDFPYLIDSTVSRQYGSGPRDTNYIQEKLTEIEGCLYRDTTMYFDKASGVLVEAYFEEVPSGQPTQKLSRTIVITSSSLWTVEGYVPDGDGGDGDENQKFGLSPEAVIGVTIAVIVIVAVATILLLKRRSNKVRNH